MYEHVTHVKTIAVDKRLDSIINESVNVLRRSRKGLLFYEPYVAGARDSEKTFNPDITESEGDLSMESQIRFTVKE